MQYPSILPVHPSSMEASGYPRIQFYFPCSAPSEEEGWRAFFITSTVCSHNLLSLVFVPNISQFPNILTIVHSKCKFKLIKWSLFFSNIFAHLDSAYGGLFVAKISKDLVVPLMRYETFCLPHFVTELSQSRDIVTLSIT